MNLVDALYFTKKHFLFNNVQLASYIGISKQKLAQIFAGHRGINSLTLKRISQILRISMDELVNNKFVLPFYHFSKHINSLYTRANDDYPKFFIQKGDFLYVRSFIDGEDKVGQLVFVMNFKTNKYDIIRYKGKFERYAKMGQIIHYHIIGKSSILYQPLEDVDFQQKLASVGKVERKRPGRPITT